MVRIKISRPGAQFILNSGSASGFGVIRGDYEFKFVDGSLSPGNSVNVNLSVTTGSDEVGVQTFQVEVSDQAGAISPTTCSGDTAVVISGNPAQPPDITVVSIANVAAASVQVSFNTSLDATSTIQFGETEDYGSEMSISSAT